MPLIENVPNEQLAEFFLKAQPSEADFTVIIQLMAEGKLNFNASDDDGKTILIKAVNSGFVDVVNSILAIVATMPKEDATKILEARDNFGVYGKTALVHAVSVENDGVEILAALITAGADPKARYNPTNNELLHGLETAAMNGHIKCLKLLLEYYIRDNTLYQKNALLLASVNGHNECMYAIAAHMALYDPWSDANNKLLKILKSDGIHGLRAALDPTIEITSLDDLQKSLVLLQSVKKNCDWVRRYRVADINLTEVTRVIENYKREHYPSRQDKAVAGFFTLLGLHKTNIVSGEIVVAADSTNHRKAPLFTA